MTMDVKELERMITHLQHYTAIKASEVATCVSNHVVVHHSMLPH